MTVTERLFVAVESHKEAIRGCRESQRGYSWLMTVTERLFVTVDAHKEAIRG